MFQYVKIIIAIGLMFGIVFGMLFLIMESAHKDRMAFEARCVAKGGHTEWNREFGRCYSGQRGELLEKM